MKPIKKRRKYAMYIHSLSEVKFFAIGFKFYLRELESSIISCSIKYLRVSEQKFKKWI